MHPALPRSDETRQLWKAVAVGVGTAALLSAIMVPALKMGISPMPGPLALVFAQTLFDAKLPLPVGLGFHVVWVTFWSVVYVVLFHDRLSFMRARTRNGAVRAGAHRLLPVRRLGLCRTGGKSDADSGGADAAPAVRGVPLGSLPDRFRQTRRARRSVLSFCCPTIWRRTAGCCDGAKSSQEQILTVLPRIAVSCLVRRGSAFQGAALSSC